MPRDSRHWGNVRVGGRVSITVGTSTEVLILRVSDEQLLFFEAFVFCGLGQTPSENGI